MAYPFIEWPTFGDFRQRLLDEFGCEYDEVATVNGTEVGCLARAADDGTYRCYGVVYEDHERLAPSIVRSICAQLLISPKEFDLHLD